MKPDDDAPADTRVMGIIHSALRRDLLRLHITEAEWTAWDEEYNIKPLSLPELGREGVWMLDGLDEESSDYVVHLVPAIPRFLILHVLGPHNRHHFADLWEGTDAESIPSQPLSSGA